MFPNELTAVILFFQQFGLAVSGAACVWGLFFLLNAGKTKEEGSKKIFTAMAEKLAIPFFFGFVISSFVWIFRLGTRDALSARYGFRVLKKISVVTDYAQSGIPVLWMVFIGLSLLT